MRTLLLLDGNNIAHRARHAFSLSGPDGLDVSVTYGFLKSLRSYLEKFKPEACIIAWDGRIPKFRREKVPTYKANRKKDETYGDFIRQLKELGEALESTGTVNIRRPAIEADDLLYHAAFLGQGFYDKIIIVTNDTDLLQAVVLDSVLVFNATKGVMADRKYVEKHSGVKIGHFVHWRALQGDHSDNIKGVPGIGPIRASEPFQKYATLNGIIDAAYDSKIRGKMGENIREFGLENISKNVFIMSLDADRTGSRLAIIQKVEDFEPADVKKFKKFLISKSFVDLMGAPLFQVMRKLQAPKLFQEAQTPVICDQRFPITENETEELRWSMGSDNTDFFLEG